MITGRLPRKGQFLSLRIPTSPQRMAGAAPVNVAVRWDMMGPM